jgi:hypothetical protein
VPNAVTYYAVDTTTGEVIDELPLDAFKFTETVSGLPGFTGSIPSRRQRAVLVTPAVEAIPPVAALDLPGGAGDYASTPDVAALTGDMDLRIYAIAPVDWSAPQHQALIERSPFDTAFGIYIDPDGCLQGNWFVGGALSVVATWGAPLPTSTRAVKVTRRDSDGRVQVFVSDDPAGGAWSQHHVDMFTTPGPSGGGAGDLVVGSRRPGDVLRLNGTIGRVEVRDGIDGTLVAAPDFAAQPAGTVTFTDEVGNDWTVAGAASIVELEPAVDYVPPVFTYVESVTRALLEPWATSVYVAFDDRLVYGGILTTAKATLAKATVELGGRNLLGAYSDGRRTVQSRAGMVEADGDLASDVRWSAGTDLFAVVVDLFDHAATFAGDLGLGLALRGSGAGGLLGVGLEDELAFSTFERRGITEVLLELAGGDPGFDFGVGYAWDLSSGNGRPVATLELDPVRGRRTGLVLEAGKNITVLDYELNGDGQANAVNAFGAGEGDTMVRTSATAAELIAPTGRYPRLETAYTNKRTKTAELLLEETRGHLARVKAPAEVITVEVLDADEVPLGSFLAGDLVQLVAVDGLIDVGGYWRITSFDVGFDADGLPRITVNATPESAYGDLFAGV